MTPEMSDFKTHCDALRDAIGATDKEVARDLKAHAIRAISTDEFKGTDSGEVIANIVLAHRHLEDARMRLGKAIQAFDGGVSVYKSRAKTSESQPTSPPPPPKKCGNSCKGDCG